MSKFVEKIAVAEEQLALIQSKIVPLTAKVDTLDQKIQVFSKLLTEITEDTVAVRREISSTQQDFDLVRTVLAESKIEGEQLITNQSESEQLHKSLTSMFGEAFLVAARFFDTAQKFGIVDKEKVSGFLTDYQPPAKSEPAVEQKIIAEIPEPLILESVPESENVAEISESALEPVSESALEPVSESVLEPVSEPVLEPVSEPVLEPVSESVLEPVSESALEPVSEPVLEPVSEPEAVVQISEPVVSPPAFADEPVFDELSNSNSDPVIAEFSPPNIDEIPTDEIPLPFENFSVIPPIEDGGTEYAEAASDLAIQRLTGIDSLDLPPLSLTTPLPEPIDELSPDEEKELEDLLTGLSEPITT